MLMMLLTRMINMRHMMTSTIIIMIVMITNTAKPTRSQASAARASALDFEIHGHLSSQTRV